MQEGRTDLGPPSTAILKQEGYEITNHGVICAIDDVTGHPVLRQSIRIGGKDREIGRGGVLPSVNGAGNFTGSRSPLFPALMGKRKMSSLVDCETAPSASSALLISIYLENQIY